MSHLMTTHDNSLGAIITLKHTFHVSMFAIRTPIRFLRIIWLQGKLPFHLKSDNQVWGWIWIRLTSLSKFDVARHVGRIWVLGSSKLKGKRNQLIKTHQTRAKLYQSFLLWFSCQKCCRINIFCFFWKSESWILDSWIQVWFGNTKIFQLTWLQKLNHISYNTFVGMYFFLSKKLLFFNY